MSTIEFNEALIDLQGNLFSFALNFTKNREDARDLTQETLLKAINYRSYYTPNTNFKAWVFTIMRNIFINQYRKKMRRGTILDQTPNNYYLNSGGQAIENDGEMQMAYKELLRMVSALPEDFKRPFWMAYKGYKYDEIAEELDAPLGTIKSRIFFARRKLQKMYEEAERMRA